MKRAFDHCVQDYARHRPTYPRDVLDILTDKLGAASARPAADVGAGTGIFTRQLALHGWRVFAIEPSLPMLRVVCQTEEGQAVDAHITPLCAAAEHLPLAGASVGLVTAAQAFHWFNPPHALAEFARVLAPGGLLALVWNNRDHERSAFVRAYESLIARYNTAYRREYRQQNWPAKIETTTAFSPTDYHRIDHVWRIAPEAFVGFSRSVSYIRNVVSRERRPAFESDLRGLMNDHFGDADCHIPLRTDLWTARRV